MQLVFKNVPFDVRYQLEENLKGIDEKRTKKLDKPKEDNPFEEGDSNLQEMPPPQSQARMSEANDQNSSSSQSGKRKASTTIDKFIALRTTAGSQPRIRSAIASEEAVHRADLAMARWLYDCCISINAMNSTYYQPMIDAIASVGLDYKGPTYHAVRTKLLQDMKKEVQLLVDECRNFWTKTGCTIMAKGWQDERNRQLISFLV